MSGQRAWKETDLALPLNATPPGCVLLGTVTVLLRH